MERSFGDILKKVIPWCISLSIMGIWIWVFTAKKVSHSKSEDGDDAEYYLDRQCGLKNGTYSAEVDYHNPATDISASYTLDVEVEDCEVIQINFENGGYLDESHIPRTEIDADGDASVEDKGGRTFHIHIDNH